MVTLEVTIGDYTRRTPCADVASAKREYDARSGYSWKSEPDGSLRLWKRRRGLGSVASDVFIRFN